MTHEELWNNLQLRYTKQHDRHTRPADAIMVGAKLWLNRRNIHTTRRSPELDVKRMGPLKIVLEIVEDAQVAYSLELPVQTKVHRRFYHVSLSEP